MNPTRTVPVEIASFAASVRAALSDLPADELDDLTEGLEADLAEAYAEDLARELPDPVEYAAELRAAAGLPEPAAARAGVRGVLRHLVAGLRESGRESLVVLRKNRAANALLDLAVSVRPAWWIARAWVAVWLLGAFFGAEGGATPTTSTWWFILLAAALVSIQWGRGAWGASRIVPVLVIGNVLAAVLFLPVVAFADARSNTMNTVYTEATVQEAPDLTGLYADGVQVTNVFAYDAKGRPLRDVQLFDSAGKPIRTSVVGGSGCYTADCDTTGFWSPAVLADGSRAWNVFPMRMIEADADLVAPLADAVPKVERLPFGKGPVVDRVASARRSALAVVLDGAGYEVSQGNQ